MKYKTSMLVIVWNDKTGEAELRRSKDFDESHRVVQLDCLIDAIRLLRDYYESKLLDHSFYEALEKDD